MTFDYDLFVIGAGSGGLAASKRAASYGAKVAIAEEYLVGGTCAVRGCIPKKLMVYASHFPGLFEAAAGYGWKVGKSALDWHQMISAVDHEVHRLSHMHVGFLERAGVKLIQSHAKFLDPHTLEVDGRKITADKILIAVGGRPVKPDLPGAEYTITSNEMFHLPQQPKHIAILGGGYIGVEFASIMNGLGSQVTQLIRGDNLLKGFDDDIRNGIYTGMTQHGIQITSNIIGKKIEQVPEGLKLTFSKEGQDTETTITADVVLAATGRTPILDGLGLENTAVEVVPGVRQEMSPGNGYSVKSAIAVDEYSRTSQSNIFAVGDCTDRINLTPVAIAEGRAFADSEFGNNSRVASHENVPSAVFSQPEAATVGLTEAQAQEKLGEAVKCYRSGFRPLFHSLTGMQEKTMMKLVVDGNTDRILGAHMVGENAAEIIQGIAITINMGATKKDFDATMAIHPSAAEEFVTMR